MKKAGKILLIVAFLFATIFIAVLFYARFDELELYEKRSSITMYNVHGNVLYETNFKKNIHWTDLDQIPKRVQDAVLAVEDKRFYTHIGFDPLRIGKAFFNNLIHQEITQGGSTITQQYAKNLYLSNEQTLQRKISEVFYALRMEMQYDKEEILEGYLNTLYYGHGVYGIANASQFFFSKDLSDLDDCELAVLIGIPNGPSIYSPLISIEQATERKNLILDILYEEELLSKQAHREAKKEAIELHINQINETKGSEQYYIDAVIASLKEQNISLDQPLYVYTNYDPQAQKALSDAIEAHVDTKEQLEVSAVVMEPFTFKVKAIAGGKDYTLSSYNRALYAKRQVASTIKPLLYYTALQQGFTPSTTFTSQPTTFQIDEKTTYAPTNFKDIYAYRDISMIQAIAVSDNIYAEKTHLFLGMDTLKEALLSFGIEDVEENPSMALGTTQMSILELAKIYTAFASEGLYEEPSFIDHITDGNGKIIYEKEIACKRLLLRDETLILNQLLTATYDPKNIGHNVPTLLDAVPNVKVAGKSGTSDYDALAAGFNPDYCVAVWSGNDDHSELDEAYFKTPKLIWRDTFNALYPEGGGSWYKRSDAIIEKRVDPISGKESSSGSVYWYKAENE